MARFIEAASASTGANGDVTLPASALEANRLVVIAQAAHTDDETFTPTINLLTSGWTTWADQRYGSIGVACSVFYRVMNGTESATVEFGHTDAGGSYNGEVITTVLVFGEPEATPLVGTADQWVNGSGTEGTPISSPSVTPSGSAAQVVSVLATSSEPTPIEATTLGNFTGTDVAIMAASVTGPEGEATSVDWATTSAMITSFGVAGFVGRDAARVRSSLREDAGSILDAVTVLPVDGSYSVAFFKSGVLDQGDLHNFYETLTPNDVAARFYPLGTPNQEFLVTYAGETKLARMARVYPTRILDTIENIATTDATINAALVDGKKVTAQDAIDYIFRQWAAEFSWFTYEAVPDLRYRRPQNDYTGTNGVLYVEAIMIPQSKSQRLTMRDIVDDWLSSFPGTVLRQNSSGNIVLQAVYGPSADASPVLTLTDADILEPGMSDGEPDPRGIYNRARVTAAGYSRQEDIQVMQSAWCQIASNANMGVAANLFTPPGVVLNLSGRAGEDGTSDASTRQAESPTESFTAENTPLFWPVGEDKLPAGDYIKLTDSSSVVQITGAWKNSGGGSGTANYVAVNDIPTNGDWVKAIEMSDTPGGEVRVTLKARWDAARSGIQLALGTPMVLETGCVFGCTNWTFEINLQDASDAFTINPVQKSASFGYDSTDTLPAVDGGNAITQSTTEYGERELSVSIRVFDPDVETLQLIAKGIVLYNITPKVVREFEQSTWRAFPVKFDHIGRLIALPNTEEALVLSRSYSDDYSPGHAGGSMRSDARAQVTNTTGAGYVDEAAGYLLLNSGEYALLDSGEIVGKS